MTPNLEANTREVMAAYAARLLAQAIAEEERGDPADVRRLLHRAALAERASLHQSPMSDWLELLAEEADTMLQARQRSHGVHAHAVAVAGAQFSAASLAGEFSRCPRLRDFLDKAVKEERIERRKLAEAERAAHTARHRFIEWASNGRLV